MERPDIFSGILKHEEKLEYIRGEEGQQPSTSLLPSFLVYSSSVRLYGDVRAPGRLTRPPACQLPTTMHQMSDSTKISLLAETLPWQECIFVG